MKKSYGDRRRKTPGICTLTLRGSGGPERQMIVRWRNEMSGGEGMSEGADLSGSFSLERQRGA